MKQLQRDARLSQTIVTTKSASDDAGLPTTTPVDEVATRDEFGANQMDKLTEIAEKKSCVEVFTTKLQCNDAIVEDNVPIWKKGGKDSLSSSDPWKPSLNLSKRPAVAKREPWPWHCPTKYKGDDVDDGGQDAGLPTTGPLSSHQPGTNTDTAAASSNSWSANSRIQRSRFNGFKQLESSFPVFECDAEKEEVIDRAVFNHSTVRPLINEGLVFDTDTVKTKL